MDGRLKKNRFYLTLATLIFACVFAACETDLKEVDRIAAIQAEELVDISTNVTVIYSDSAFVKAKLTAPEMRNYQTDSPYYEFQKGITIIFYDEHAAETQRITSDYAMQKQLEELIEFRRNVVITRADGALIKTEELIHDQKANTFYNHVPIEFYSKKDNLMGTSFTADGNFEKIDVQGTTFLYNLEAGKGPSF